MEKTELRNLLNKRLGLELRRLEVAASFWSLAKGLMFRKGMPKGSALLMDLGKPKMAGIWMLFMRFPIDIIFLDENLRTVGEKKNARPLRFYNPLTWRVYYPKKKARYVLEIKSG